MDINDEMWYAALSGYMDIVQLMISKGATVFNTAMISAASSGHMNIVQLMISKGATNFNSAMASAAEGGHMDIIQLMISKGATDFNWAMYYAAEGGHIDIVKLMISKGATDFNIANISSHIANFLRNLSHDEVKLTKYRQALVKYFQIINNREQILTLFLVNRYITFGTGIPLRICEFF
jgi:ankyrin repeat protein